MISLEKSEMGIKCTFPLLKNKNRIPPMVVIGFEEEKSREIFPPRGGRIDGNCLVELPECSK